MTATYINICTDSELEAKAQSVLEGLGIDLPTAINGFLAQVIKEKNLPFALPFEKDTSKIVPRKRPRSEIRGCMEVWLSDDFDAPLEEMQEYME
jgi:addiction module RelB/DinJ family antitoxin